MPGSGRLTADLSSATRSTITPTYDVPDMGPQIRQGYEALSNIGGVVQDAIEARLKRAGAEHAKEMAAQTDTVVEAGETPTAAPKVSAGHRVLDVVTHGAYSRAFETASAAALRTDIDDHDQKLRSQFAGDPAGYQAAAAKALSGFIQGSPEDLAVHVEDYGTEKFKRGYLEISRVAEDRERRRAANDIGVRVKALDERLDGLAAAGMIDSDEFFRAHSEREALQIERTRNPVISYSDVQRQVDDDKMYDDLHGAAAAHQAAIAYGEAGGGLPGLAAAYRELNSEVLNGEAFAKLSPDRRLKIYNAAKRQVTAQSDQDIKDRQAEHQAEQEERQAERDRVGDLRLAIATGGVTEKQILARTDIDPRDKATLVDSARAMARRARVEERAANAAERAASAAVYREYSDAAAAGTLSSDELAAAVESRQLQPGQARTLAARRDRSLAPVVEDIMAPVKDAGRMPGMAGRPHAEAEARAEEWATDFARKNPNATLEERLKYGKAIADRLYGGAKLQPGANSGPAGQSARRSAARTAAYADFKAGKIDRPKLNARLEAANNAR